MWLHPAEEPVAVLPEVADIAIDLLVPVAKICLVRQVGCLVDERRTQAAGIDLLQAHDIIVADQAGDAIEILFLDRMRQEMLPALGNVIPVLRRFHAGLDVVTQQPETLPGREPVDGILEHAVNCQEVTGLRLAACWTWPVRSGN